MGGGGSESTTESLCRWTSWRFRGFGEGAGAGRGAGAGVVVASGLVEGSTGGGAGRGLDGPAALSSSSAS